MKKPSNQMPKYEVPKTSIWTWIFLVVTILSLCYAAYEDINVMYLFVALIIFIIIMSTIGDKKYERLKESRKDWNIGSFAKEFNLKEVDTWVVRAVYEAVYDEVEIPIKADDDIDKDLRIDMGDLGFDEILINVSQRTGRVLTEESVAYNDIENITSIRDLVYFFNGLQREKE